MRHMQSFLQCFVSNWVFGKFNKKRVFLELLLSRILVGTLLIFSCFIPISFCYKNNNTA